MSLFEVMIMTHFNLKSVSVNSLPSFWAKLGYSQIKIDHFADSLLKLQIRIGVHLIYKCWTDTTPYSALCTAHRVMNEAWKQKMTCFCVCSTGHFCSFVIHFICVWRFSWNYILFSNFSCRFLNPNYSFPIWILSTGCLTLKCFF